jgi:tetratricopeptide (TPR) repeat protein
MNEARWRRMLELYDAALDVPESERRSRLSSLVDGDPGLVDEVLLLLQNEAAAAGFLVPPRVDGIEFSEGEVVAERFRIVRLLGRGGMGAVYEAEDLGLSESVAIKIVRGDLQGDSLAQQRLRREALLARRITHENLCRIHDVVEHRCDGKPLTVVTMELLCGETLSARLRREGKLSEGETERITRQLLAGLTVAHQAGVVHRDLKPANVMLMETRAVVMDFGLAVARKVMGEPDGNSLTRSGQLLGTPEYMAPEQLRGGDATPASDIYALGVTIYEMLTGRRPSQGASGLQEVINRVLEPVASPRLWNPAISRRLETVVLGCLERDPDRRYPSAAEVEKALNFGSSWPRLARPAIGRRPILGLGAAAVAGGAWWLWRQRLPLPLNPMLIVAPVAGLPILGTFLRRQLEQSGVARLWSPSQFAEAARSMRLVRNAPEELTADEWRALGSRVQADFLLHSTVSPVAGESVIHCVLERIGADSPAVLRKWEFTRRFRGEPASLSAIRDVANWVRATLGETQENIARRDSPPEFVTTGSHAALRLFEQAEAVKSASPKEAISLLASAVRIDPEFGLAWMRLGDLEVTNYDWNSGLAHWKRAVELADAGKMSLSEAHRVRTLYALELGETQRVEAEARRWAMDFPNEAQAAWEVFQAQLMMGRLNDAEISLKNLAGVAGGERFYLLGDMIFGLWNRDLDRVQRGALRLRVSGRQPFYAARTLGVAAALRGQFDAAFKVASETLRLTRPLDSSKGFSLLAVLQAWRGSRSEARETLQRGLSHDRKTGMLEQEALKLLSLSYLAWLDGDKRELRLNAELAVRKGRSLSVLPMAVALLFRSGQANAAKRIRELWNMPADCRRFRAQNVWMDAEELLALGKGKQAVRRMEDWIPLRSSIEPWEPRLHVLRMAREFDLAKSELRDELLKPAGFWYSPESYPAGLLEYCYREVI